MSEHRRTALWTLAVLGLLILMLTGLAAACGSQTEPTTTTAMMSTELPDNDPLAPTDIPKFKDALVIPPVMEPISTDGLTKYAVAARQFEQQVLPAGLPKTTVWGYGRLGDPLPGGDGASSFNFPGFTIEARVNEKIQVEWVNQLVDDPESDSPNYLPHLLPIDQTIHWANPSGDMDAMSADKSYRGPVPIVTHVHGAHVASTSDGNPEAWYLPDAANIPDGYMTQGDAYATAGTEDTKAGSALFEYTNDQRATTLWYHDHALGMTRTNVYAGLAGFWILRDDAEDAMNLPGPAPKLGDAAGTKYYEIPLAIQDRSFNKDGSLNYPDSRAFFDEYAGPYSPETDVPPIWNPEFFGDTMLVNGKTWPYLEVEPRLYRFRVLNGCNARFLIIKFDNGMQFTQIGNEGGLLRDAPIALDQLLMAPAERADLIVDFSSLKPGDQVVMQNVGPDSPLGELPVAAEDLADPGTTGQVMQFRVVELTNQGNAGAIPTELPAIEPLSTDLPERNLTLNEMANEKEDIPVEALLGTAEKGGLAWDDPITENPMVGDTEVWRIINLTMDSHPIHLHLINFQVLDRTPFDSEAYQEAQSEYLDSESDGQGTPPDPFDFATGEAEKPQPWEAGWKDTVMATPDHITRIIANFDMEGLYVWHCHILEHEDNEMMRPYYVGVMPTN